MIEQVSQTARSASEDAQTLDRLIRDTQDNMAALDASVRIFKV